MFGGEGGRRIDITSSMTLYCGIFQNIVLSSFSTMMLLYYEEGLRVVIHTANLIEKDLDQKTQATQG